MSILDQVMRAITWANVDPYLCHQNMFTRDERVNDMEKSTMLYVFFCLFLYEDKLLW